MIPPPERSQSGFTSDLPDRLAMTAKDRALESSVMIGLLRLLGQSEFPDSFDESPSTESGGMEGVGATRRLFEDARKIAAFLAVEFRAESVEQKVFIAELAAEMAQRIAEEFPGRSAGGRPIP